MRILLMAGTALLCPVTMHALVVNSIADGLWQDPATWDCACVPADIDEVNLFHAITFDVPLTDQSYLPHPQVTIHPGATMSCLDHIVLDGNMDIQGLFTSTEGLWIEGPGSLVLSGQLEVFNLWAVNGGTFSCTGYGSAINFYVYPSGNAQGSGILCVMDTTWNMGSIQGTLDICDLSPTTAIPPILDINSGVVDPGVTFCATPACITSVGSVDPLAAITLYPDPASGQVTISGPTIGLDQVFVMDGVGRTISLGISPGGTVDISGLASGSYTVLLRSAQGSKAIRLIVE